MSLPRPILDDRSYQQLRDELVRRVPVYNPEWTDHNASDPGITLLELFAFLGENLLFRFNQIPEATRLAFLDLLQIPLRPASPARALLQLEGRTPDGTTVPEKSPASAGAIPFESETEVAVFPLEARAFARACSTAPTGDPEADAAIIAVGATPSGVTFYETAAVPEDPSAPGAPSIDFQCTVDRALWVAVLGTDDTDLAKLAKRTINLGVALDDLVPGLDAAMRGEARCTSCGETAASLTPAQGILRELAPCPGDGASQPSTDVVWHVSTGRFEKNDELVPHYERLDVDGDLTRGLRQSGVVRLRLPVASDLGKWMHANPDVEGTGDFPPRIDDEKIAARLLFWLRAARRTPDAMPRVRWVGVNVTQVVQTRTANAVALGTGTGQPRQEYRLLNQNVVADSVQLEVETVADRFEPWTEVRDFDASTESDTHFVLDSASGTVRFGDGLHGRLPQPGQRIRTRGYRYGGGAPGNVPAKAISKLDRFPSLTAANPLPARGGADAESVAEGLERVPAELRRNERAVTESDFVELAKMTPGGQVGRADVLARFYPPLRKSDAAGVVTVVVWPTDDALHPTAPTPGRALLDSVCAYLDQRRLVTTELWVIPPSYVQLAVSVGVRIKPGYGIEAVRSWVDRALRQYLAPLPPFGPEGRGWPLGRAVDTRELSAVAQQVEGVLFIEGLDLAWRAGSTDTWKPVSAAAPQVKLERWQVVELAALTVVEGAPEPAGKDLAPAPVSESVPVPIPREEECCR
ncbi:MAG: putative baseplate assembly protein [Myxococcaceae bacterium]